MNATDKIEIENLLDGIKKMDVCAKNSEMPYYDERIAKFATEAVEDYKNNKHYIAEIIRKHPAKRSAAEWAFRWLMEQPEVTCVLSGMNSMEMVKENIRIASEVKVGEFTEQDHEMIAQIKNEINRTIKVNCTACQYCMPCPKGVDIPGTFRCYNEIYTDGSLKSARREYMQTTSLQKQRKDAYQCVDCGKCEQHCPQHLPIRQHLKAARKELLPLHYRIGIAVARLFKFW